MGAKARQAMEAARRSLEARKAEAFGPAAPPCAACGQPSKGTVLHHLPTGGAKLSNVCSPLRCAFEVAGDMSATASWAPHRPGSYRDVA